MTRRSEFDFIESLRSRRDSSSLLVRGIGDDAAVLNPRPGFELVVTTDLLVESVDFLPNNPQVTPESIGHKALAVSLSDIAAMGATPLWALLSLGVSQAVWKGRFIDSFFKGFDALANKYRVTLVGGDISSTPDKTVVDSIVIGEVRRSRSIPRSGAKPGDGVFVTGWLGGAAAGLRILQTGSTKARGRAIQLIRRQIMPEPRVEWGSMLSDRRTASSMIDVSDGLSSDLAHVCRESNVGATIDESKIPIDPAMKELDSVDSMSLALNGGEDFELLFTVRPRNFSRLPSNVGGIPVTQIGEITTGRKLLLITRGRTRPLFSRGFQHFK